MDNEKEKRDVAGDTLKGEPAIVHVWIGAGVCLGSHGDADAVDGVEGDRQKDEPDLQGGEVGQVMDPVDFLVEDLATTLEEAEPIEGPRVRQEVFNQKGADGHDAAERMEFSEQKMVLLLKGLCVGSRSGQGRISC